jgi:uncharacterized Rmd1/YagE family protein
MEILKLVVRCQRLSNSHTLKCVASSFSQNQHVIRNTFMRNLSSSASAPNPIGLELVDNENPKIKQEIRPATKEIISNKIKKQGMNVAAANLISKQRSGKKKSSTFQTESTLPSFKIKAYATADFYNLDILRENLIKTGAYEVLDAAGSKDEIPDDCLCVRAKYQEINESETRHIFFFENGCVVFWNVSSAEQNSLLQMMQKTERSYPPEVVTDESETMQYYKLTPSLLSQDSNDHDQAALAHFRRIKKTACLFRNNIYFLDDPNTSLKDKDKRSLLEKYAFSDAISSSVKLGIYEKNLDDFTERIEFISSDLKQGTLLKLKSEDVLQFLGELFTMRHVVNLHFNFLGTPDFYWDREDLGVMYEELYAYLSISKRTKLFNERLNHCVDLMEITKQHLSDNKHTRLEWIIIGLITIEVLIGLGIFDALKVTVIDTLKAKF